MMYLILPWLALVVLAACRPPDDSQFHGVQDNSRPPRSLVITRDGTRIHPGCASQFGSVCLGTHNEVTFAVSNSGTTDLELAAPIAVDGSDAALFTVTSPPDSRIVAGGSSAVTVDFCSATSGVKTAELAIASNDPGGTPFTLALTATAIDPPARIASTGQVTSYLAGDDGDLRRGAAWPSPRFVSNGDGTVMDNLTGLVWQKDPTIPSYGWSVDWTGALNHANGLGLAGWSDWRLANLAELHSLVNAEASSPAAWLNSQGFASVNPSGYWSSTVSDSDPTMAWVLHLEAGGGLGRTSMIAPRCALAVRSGGTGTAPLCRTGKTASMYPRDDGDLEMGLGWIWPRFADNGNGTVTDCQTGLMWQGAPSTSAAAWQEAAAYARGATLAGYSDWRLPNVRELASLLHYGIYTCAGWLNGQGFVGVKPAAHWTSTTYAPNTTHAWMVWIDPGSIVDGDKTSSNYVLITRGGP